MRDLVLRSTSHARTASNTLTARTRTSPHVLSIASLEDYHTAIMNTPKVVCVRFYAPWCKACLAVAPHFYHLAQTYADDCLFLDVPVTHNNLKLYQGLGVESLPYGHIYLPELGLVEETMLTRQHMAEFREKVKHYVQQQQRLEEQSFS